MEDKNINDVWLLLGQMDTKLDRVVTDAADHETRINKIEKARFYERGFMAAIAGGISLAVTFLRPYH